MTLVVIDGGRSQNHRRISRSRRASGGRRHDSAASDVFYTWTAQGVKLGVSDEGESELLSKMDLQELNAAFGHGGRCGAS